MLEVEKCLKKVIHFLVSLSSLVFFHVCQFVVRVDSMFRLSWDSIQ